MGGVAWFARRLAPVGRTELADAEAAGPWARQAAFGFFCSPPTVVAGKKKSGRRAGAAPRLLYGPNVKSLMFTSAAATPNSVIVLAPIVTRVSAPALIDVIATFAAKPPAPKPSDGLSLSKS